MSEVLLQLTVGIDQEAEFSEGNNMKLQASHSDGPEEKENLQAELVDSSLSSPLHNWTVEKGEIQEPLQEETALKGPVIPME